MPTYAIVVCPHESFYKATWLLLSIRLAVGIEARTDEASLD